MKIINGKEISQKIRFELKEKIELLTKKTGKQPGLATILVGEDPASKVYVGSKIKACEQVGIKSYHNHISETASIEDIISLIEKLNKDKNIHGILLQLPLPNKLDADRCIRAIDYNKDVDGLHPYNAGMLTLVKSWDEIVKQKLLVSCTPMGVIYLLKYSNVDIAGKNRQVKSCRQTGIYVDAFKQCNRYNGTFKNTKFERDYKKSRYCCCSYR